MEEQIHGQIMDRDDLELPKHDYMNSTLSETEDEGFGTLNTFTTHFTLSNYKPVDESQPSDSRSTVGRFFSAGVQCREIAQCMKHYDVDTALVHRPSCCGLWWPIVERVPL